MCNKNDLLIIVVCSDVKEPKKFKKLAYIFIYNYDSNSTPIINLIFQPNWEGYKSVIPCLYKKGM